MFKGKLSVLLALFPTLALQSAVVDYSRDIQPVLAEHCFHCHGMDEKTRKGNLRLDDREAALKGGKNDGPAIVPGQPDKSALLARILSHDPDEVMPPPKEKKPVLAADVSKLREWIAEGAPYSGHWAFTAPVKVALPEGSSHPVDAFVLARLKKEGLSFSPAASPETICRRLHLDLIGLPPAPAALDAFLQDVGRSGLERATRDWTETLLKDRRYGEKWARHWLDVARYSDSNGFEKDLPRDQWAWRDWVIEAMNSDLPYDRFLMEQLAGDLLPDASQEQRIATGFLRNSMLNEEGAIIPEEWRMEAMFDRMDAVGSGMLGLSLRCAQCHTHKFDPISHTEYYGVFAFLNNAYEAKSWVYSKDGLSAITNLQAALRKTEDELKKAHPDWEKQMATWEEEELKRWRQTEWTVIKAEDTHSSSELNHPVILPDNSILTLGHPTTGGDIHLLAEPALDNVTGIRLEVLTHGDLPMNGPGRSYKGSWALSELIVEAKAPGSNKWERLPLKQASADFEESAAGMEPEWASPADKENRRQRGPAAFLADGDPKTAWRADRGAGRRNTDSVAVAQFEKPLTLPPGTKLKVALLLEHSDGGNGYRNTMIGRFRVALTKASDPKVGRTPYAAILALQTPADRRSPEQKQALFDAWRMSNSALSTFNDQLAKHWAGYPEAKTTVLHLAERTPADLRETRRLDRGVWSQGKEVIEPQVPSALHSLPADVPRTRLAFARWVADRRSPLTARVAVNRVWQAVFGVGIVETADDFGTRSPEPSHRELLDWLAVDFMDNGWSQKHLLRTLLSSAVYQQSSHSSPSLVERDPKNRLLARGPRFRAEAEVVRDLVLSASGLLSDKFGGPSVFPPMPQSVLDFNFFRPDYWKPAEDATRYSRALYVFRKRSMPDPTLIAFDAPTGDTSCTRRPRSNSPLAALTAMNEPIFVEAAQALALRVLREGGADDGARAEYAFRLCTSRRPTEQERREILSLLESRRQRLKRGELKASEIAFSSLTKPQDIPPEATPNEVAAWAVVARVLLNLDETIAKN
ncbi:MAG: PSD1 domain-containing protein [Verrucomicrobiales bacterium]|nr:PSD1 domain-containing protein [Verrucomicrobiales bacterium]